MISVFTKKNLAVFLDYAMITDTESEVHKFAERTEETIAGETSG